MWAKQRKGPDVIMDREPADNGNIYFLEDGTVAYKRKTIPGQPPYYISHFVTCPDARTWRAP